MGLAWLLVVLSAAGLARPFVDGVEIEVGRHAVALPFGHLTQGGPLHPAAGLAIEHGWTSHGALALVQTARAGAFHHRFVGTSAVLGTDLVARVAASRGPMAELGVGGGASLAWRARRVLAWDEEATTYRPAGDPGRPGLVGGFTVGVGYEAGRRGRVPLAVTLRYRWFVQSPFLPAIPLGPQGVLSLGVRWTGVGR